MPLSTTLKVHERHLSAVAMVGGFVVDNLAFGRVDHPATQIVLAAYILIAATSIIVLHYFEEKTEHAGTHFRWSAYVSAATQFAFGGLWSAFLIFYSRSAVIETAWPFLVILLAILLGNEVFRDYRAKLVFTSILLFFAIFSYATFVLPIFENTMDTHTFLLSECVSIFAFLVFILAVALLARSRIRRDLSKIVMGAAFIFILLNTFYYMDILPPLPLALADAEILPSRDAVALKYSENIAFLPWFQQRTVTKTFRVSPGQALYAYSAVFAPRQLKTRIVHEWDWYDANNSAWVTKAVIAFPIVGGRDNGYRAYSYKNQLPLGAWRVDIETPDGRIIGRIKFSVERS